MEKTAREQQLENEVQRLKVENRKLKKSLAYYKRKNKELRGEVAPVRRSQRYVDHVTFAAATRLHLR